MFISLPLYYSPRPLAATTWCPLAFGELNIYRQLIYRNVIHVHCPLQISVKFTLIFSCHSLCQFMSDARDCESYLRQLQETIKRQYTCDKNSRLSKLEDLLQDSMVQYLLPSAAHISFFFFFTSVLTLIWQTLATSSQHLIILLPLRCLIWIVF